MASRESKHESAGIAGEVRWYDVAHSRAVRRILEKSVARWLELQGFDAYPEDGVGSGDVDGQPRYHAILQREGDGHLVHCQIEVWACGKTWIGSRIGRGTQQALADCLAHMSKAPQAVPLSAA